MNRKQLIDSFAICLFGLIIMNLAACNNEIIEIEEHNTYRWQRYMNEEEYKNLEKGMSYIDVVKIAGGAGVKVDESIYEWDDEILLTKGYQIHFEDGDLIKKEIVKRKGYSKR
ncbi:MAG: hypothetical protein RR642_07855 [Solibacillus sp.]